MVKTTVVYSDPSPKSFMSEYQAANARAVALVQRLPHLLPHKMRVKLFRDTIANDRIACGINTRRNLLGSVFDEFDESLFTS